MMIKMIENKLCNSEKTTQILEELNPPKGKSYVKEILNEEREKRMQRKEEKLRALRDKEKEELEKKEKEIDPKEVFQSQMNASTINVEELDRTTERSSKKNKEVKFDENSHHENEVSPINHASKSQFVPTSMIIKESSVSSKAREGSSDINPRFKSHKPHIYSLSSRRGL